MYRIHLPFAFFIFALHCSVACCASTNGDQEDSVATGEAFLNNARIDQWDKYFTDGLPRLGKITQKANGKLVSEAWIEKEYYFEKRPKSGDVTQFRFSNPDYSALIEYRGGLYKIVSVSVAPSPDFVQIGSASSITFCSVVNLTKRKIPRFLQEGNMRITNYRHEDQKHFIELGLVGNQELARGGDQVTELVFYDGNPSLLPNEAIFYKGTENARHFVCTNFAEFEGYHFPLEMQETGGPGVTTEVSPKERLNREMCYLKYYGLPEPDKLPVAATEQLGGERNDELPWRRIIFWALVTIGVVSGAVARLQKRYSEG